MTTDRNERRTTAAGAMASTSGSLDLELLGLRVTGQQLGDMLGVSRQAVSKAVKSGRISRPGADGLFDARRASREWLDNSNPAKTRARVLKDAIADHAELRQQVRDLAAEVKRLQGELQAERDDGAQRAQHAAWRESDSASQALGDLLRALQSRWAEAAQARADGRLDYWLEELAAVEFYAHDLAEFREMFPEDECAADDAELRAACDEADRLYAEHFPDEPNEPQCDA